MIRLPVVFSSRASSFLNGNHGSRINCDNGHQILTGMFINRKKSVFTESISNKQHRKSNHERDSSWGRKTNSRRWGAALLSCLSFGTVVYGYSFSKKHHISCSSKLKETEVNSGDQNWTNKETVKVNLKVIIELSRDLCQRIKDETGSPGLTVSVMVDGREMWSEGFGYADLENRVQAHSDSVMRIASISKSIAMTIVAKLWEEKKLDLDKPIHEYLPEWPEKTFEGQKVEITLRQLVSHLSGVRHYDKNCGKKKKDQKQKSGSTNSQEPVKNKEKETNKEDDDEKEFYSKKHYSSAITALEVFKNDPLCSKPGTQFLYTTHGWTLVSAVIEKVTNKKITENFQQLFKDLGLNNTYLDENRPIIYNRVRQYTKNERGRIINAPYVDNSNKWAGGGLLSTSRDLAKFGNLMLYSHQYRPQCDVSGGPRMLPGYLQPSTVGMMWAPVPRAKLDWDADGHYGMGWGAVTSGGSKYGHCKEVREYASHTGGAVGGSSVLIVLPKKGIETSADIRAPRGVVVAMMANSNAVGLRKTAIDIAKMFESLESV